jgi:tetratricopeptide (TPR) repeat protein
MGMRMASEEWQPDRPRMRWRPVAAVGLLAFAAYAIANRDSTPRADQTSQQADIEPAAFFEPPSVPEMVDAEPLMLARRPQPLEQPALAPLPPAASTDALPVIGGLGADNASLLPPQPMPADGKFTEWTGLAGEYQISPEAAAEAVPQVSASQAETGTEPKANVAKTEVGENNSKPSPKDSPLADTTPFATGAPTSAVVDERAQEKIRRGFALAQRGASFAARSEFTDVLKLIAGAKDEQDGSPQRTTALANGLRALEEVNDFAPRMAQPESNLSIAVILSSHRTPAAKEPGAEKLMPQQLADQYFRYAQRQLAQSVAGEPAGSMALHALGKLFSQLGRVEPEKQPLAERKAFALQQAALLARDDNHLAAHELGVLLAESGHYPEAEYLLNQVAIREPNPVVFRNLSRVERKLGHVQLAELSDEQAEFMLSRGTTGSSGVEWVSPGALAQTGDPLAPAASTNQVAGQTPAEQQKTAAAPAMREPVRDVTRRPGGPVLR